MAADNPFVLDPRLERDTLVVDDWPLSRVLLMNDARYPWLILVPRRPGLSEWHDLAEGERAVLAGETARASASLKALTGAAKINVGALGNIVLQLHVHVVARFPGDPAWPGPVWGNGKAEPYDRAKAELRIAELKARL